MADRKCPTAEEALTMATLELIRKGYHVETLAVNPQTISAWKRYHLAIIERTFRARETAEDSAGEISVPMVNATETSSPPVALVVVLPFGSGGCGSLPVVLATSLRWRVALSHAR